MNYYILVYPILSLACFFTVFFYPQTAAVLLFLSPLVLLAYLENPVRTRTTDVASGVIFIASAVIDPRQTIYFIPIVLLPMLILTTARDKAPGKAYLAPLTAPLPLTLSISAIIALSADLRDMANKSMLDFITAITAPLEGTADKLGDMGILSVMLADKAQAAEYLTYLLPCIAFSVISVFTFVIDRIRPKFCGSFTLTRDFRLPDGFVWGLIGGGFLILVNDEHVKFFSINIIVIFGMLYFFQGVQMMSVLFDRLRFGGIFRSLIYVFLFTEPPVIAALALMGLFSIWFRPGWSMREPKDGEGGNGSRR